MNNTLEDYITAADYARLHGIPPVTVRQSCARGRMPGAIKIGTPPHQIWLIPKGAVPEDRRVTSGKYRNWRKPKEDEQKEE